MNRIGQKRMIHEELRVPKQNLFMGLLLLSPHGNQQQGESLVLLRFNSCMVPGHLYSYATTIYRKDNNRMEKRIKKKSHVVSIMCRLVSYRRVIADGGGGGDGCCWSSGRQKSRQIVTSANLYSDCNILLLRQLGRRTSSWKRMMEREGSSNSCAPIISSTPSPVVVSTRLLTRFQVSRATWQTA